MESGGHKDDVRRVEFKMIAEAQIKLKTRQDRYNELNEGLNDSGRNSQEPNKTNNENGSTDEGTRRDDKESDKIVAEVVEEDGRATGET